ncbi:MAG: asparagine synthase (glutamine-hydrolyzing) [Bacteroidota bacterium]|jgi:asparagine synthase (glutamine-hydrolysing)|nr:asparagine synthase (glutamine-hydrolyzing) [Bacteroidia bacterium]
MCGIAGFIDPSLAQADREPLIQKMLGSISHRGPDATNSLLINQVALGHNRLSILDLSDAANQPMRRGDLVMVFNGEIYNYLEIRKELESFGHRFHTQSDSEVILSSYEQWGAACVQRFVGMWALAIWDSRKEELFCSRDRFGIKPFLYILEGDRFYFGSEYKALRPSPVFSNDLNMRQIRRGLQMGWVVYQDETYFEKVKALPEACNLLYRNGKVKIERYWDLQPLSKDQRTYQEKTIEFRERLIDSLRLHMRSDVEVGACLSGGIDSSSITSIVGHLYPDVDFRTFTIYYAGENAVDERPFVKSILQKYPHIRNVDYSPQKEALRECFHRMCYHIDVPTNWSSDISQYYVMELAGRHKMKVLLDGQGSDEFLGGYMHSFYRLIGNELRQGHLATATRLFRDHRTNQEFGMKKSADVWAKSMMSAVFTEQQLYSMEYRHFHPYLHRDPDRNAPFRLAERFPDKLDNFLYNLIFQTLLPSLLHFEDRNSMAFSIESRVPFLDHRLVEFGFRLKSEDRIRNGVTKSILRDSMRGILPDEILNRSDKKGFTTPGAHWLRTDMHFLLEQDFSSLDFLDQRLLRKLIKEFEGGNDKLAQLLWRVGGLGYWTSHFN